MLMVKRRPLSVSFFAVLCACGGGGGGDGGGASAPTQGGAPPSESRALVAAQSYLFGPLTAPTGQPFFRKTVIGDLDGDGRNDVVTFTNETLNGSDVVVLYQDQAGELSTFITMNSRTDLALTNVRDIAIADMNADGLNDLVIYGLALPVSVGHGPPLAVLYQDASGNLSSLATYSIILGGSPLGSFTLGLSFAVGDLNGDGRNDVAFSGSPMTAVLQGPDGKLGEGPGSLGSTFSLTVFSRSIGSEIRIADMDADGDNDIVFQSADNVLGVLRQAGGVFDSTAELYSVSLPGFNTFAVGDLNGDGKNDVVVLGEGNSGPLNVFLQNNGGTLSAPPLLIPITSSPLYGVEIADVDGDGRNDIAGEAVDPNFPTGRMHVYVFYQQADHSFQNAIGYRFLTSAGGGSPEHQALSIGDINGDGWPDAVASWRDEGIFVYLNTRQ